MSGMRFIHLSLLVIGMLYGCGGYEPASTVALEELREYYNPNPGADTEGEGRLLLIDTIAGPDIVPSPSCLAVSPSGEVFVGVDMIGSLGKEPGKGSIVKLLDEANDGIYEKQVEFVKVDNPRGVLPIGDQVFVLYTVFDAATGLAAGMDLVVFEDKDQDDVADGPPMPLIKNMSSLQPLKSRGTDHATNGIRMGIDGWIYVAVGDFGFHNAEDRSGTKLSMLGGGIVRVRPDGTEMEIYAHGTRNIYDVAIDPFMNIYTRGNTNDGGGWNIRFIHYVQSGEYGYPSLFKNFTDEIIPALVDVGGGSGTGSYFMDDDRWPVSYNHVPMMADWGKNELFIHRVAMDGPGFTQNEEKFIGVSQITDVDLDGSGRMFLSAWDGAGYRGSPDKGYVLKVVPEDWTYEPFPNLETISTSELGDLLTATNSVTRLHAQQALLKKPKEEAASVSLAVAKDQTLPLAARVAGVYTYAQLLCADGVDELLALSREDKMREFALRALTDRVNCLSSVPVAQFMAAVQDANPRVQAAAIVGLGRLGQLEAAASLLAIQVPTSAKAPEPGTEGPHATPNSEILVPHLAVRSLVKLHAVDATVKAIDSNPGLALWALRYLHDPVAVEGLIAAYERSEDEQLKDEFLSTLSRLYQKEAPYEGDWWWGTRPDTHGPYYKGMNWESSERIKEFLIAKKDEAASSRLPFFARLNDRNRLGIGALGTNSEDLASEETTVDLEAIKNRKGQVGRSSIEDVILAVAEIDGDPVKGKALFVSQGCVACHSIEKGQAMKGPFMGQIGSIMNRDQITESILKPNASISQGFSTYVIETKDDKSYMGFITAESADNLTLRDIAGTATEFEKSNIKSRQSVENSMMPAGLANALSFDELASLVAYLQIQK